MEIVVPLCCSFLLTLFLYSNLLHELLKHGPFPWACSPSGYTCCTLCSSPWATMPTWSQLMCELSIPSEHAGLLQGLPWAAGRISALYLAAAGQTPSPQFSPLVESAPIPGAPPPPYYSLTSLFSDLWCVQCCFSHLFFYFPNYFMEWNYSLTMIA